MTTIMTIAGALLAVYAVLLGALLVARPRGLDVREALRLLPDLVRLVRRLAADHSIPRGPRIGLWLLLAYLALPFDLVPDFIPVLGYADDAILVAVVLRWVIRAAGPATIRQRWPGTESGLRAIGLLTGRPPAEG